jgi:hypothetical protein
MTGEELLEYRRRCAIMAIEHERVVHHRDVDPDHLALMNAWAAGDADAEAEVLRIVAARRPRRPLTIHGVPSTN